MALQEYIPIQWVNGSAPAINAVNLSQVGTGVKNVTDAVITLEASVENLMPVGAVILFSGATIPDGWALCDGTGGTPNLIDKFIMGGQVAENGVTGGYKDSVNIAHNHSASTGGSGAHAHNIPLGEGGGWSNPPGGIAQRSYWSVQETTDTSSSVPNHTHSVTVNSSGVSGTNRNLPPYYKLAYIMKIA